MNEPSLESPADHETLKVLRDAGALSPEAFWSGIRATSDAQMWALWTRRLFLIIGATLVIAALVYFFAYNWEAPSHPVSISSPTKTAGVPASASKASSSRKAKARNTQRSA